MLHLHDTLKMYMQNLYKLVLNYFPKAPYSQLIFFHLEDVHNRCNDKAS